MISVIDYKAGNLQSVLGGFKKCGADIRLITDPQGVEEADALVLPGVGAFELGMKNLIDQNLVEPIREKVESGTPFLGICLGLQLLFSESEENGLHKGLDIVPGRVVKFKKGLKIPHMGWNSVGIQKETPLFAGVQNDSYFYFVHSYYCVPENDSDSLGKTGYGIDFTSCIARGNLYGTQFHPEKSQDIGARLLKNFISIAENIEA